MTIITDDRCTGYASSGHPERPERISRTLDRLRTQMEFPFDWAAPGPVKEAAIQRAHSAKHIARLDQAADFDGDTPWYENIGGYARASVAAALAALAVARQGKMAFSLMRPPGHHATRDRVMGFCYLNSVAIAALEAAATGAKRVAVFDFDVHHGNGTENILLDYPGIACFSIHLYPFYPGTGGANVGGNCFNYPVAPGTPRAAYRAAIQQAFENLKAYRPDLIAAAAGFDAYRSDPLGEGSLEAEDFHWIGQSLRRFSVPCFSVLEGGYSSDLPELILAYLQGLTSR